MLVKLIIYDIIDTIIRVNFHRNVRSVSILSLLRSITVLTLVLQNHPTLLRALVPPAVCPGLDDFMKFTLTLGHCNAGETFLQHNSDKKEAERCQSSPF